MEILKTKQVRKFAFYGFFKNLRFFEPYLLIYFIENSLSFFQIGLLFSIREAVIYIFEVPSGVIADYYGKKNELMMCFIFYIISFIMFFVDTHFWFMIIAMIFFGLGEAFRSGTHKSMIYEFLEKKDLYHLKSRVYGFTRSYSKIGSSISSFASIIIVLNIEHYKTIFIFSIIPYILDFLLIKSYPDYFNKRETDEISIRIFYELIKKQIKSIFENLKLKDTIFNSAIYNSVFTMIKDYIQPVIVMLLFSIFTLKGDIETLTKIYLGVTYGFFSIGSVIVSRNSYKINEYISAQKAFKVTFLLLSILLITLSFTINYELIYLTLFIYFYIYVSKDLRKPQFVEICGNLMKKTERATVMSVANQIKSSLVIFVAPILGLISDQFGIDKMFLILGSLILIIYIILINPKN
ncbi:MAG: MFS transporter [Bacillota bacterium]